MGSVNRYWWAIGMIGTVTPTIRPISGANMPPALTTMSAAISVRSPFRSTVTPVTRPRSVPIATTLVCGRICAPRWRAPAASALARPDGSSQPSVGSQTAPRTPSVDISGNRACASCGADQLERESERLGPAGLPAELLEPLGARREPQRADLVPRRIGPGLGGQAPVEVGAVHHHLGQRDRAPQLADEAGRMERRARGQLRAVDQDDVGPAALGEVVRDRGPADAAADDDRPGVFHHRCSALPCPPTDTFRVAAAIPSRGATDHRAGHRGDPGLGGAEA